MSNYYVVNECVGPVHGYYSNFHTGEDYGSTGLLPGTPGNCSKLEWRAGNSTLNNCFLVPIIDDDIPEPIEVFEIFVECEANGNCYLPRQQYTITIIDDQGTYNYILSHLNHPNIKQRSRSFWLQKTQ